MSLALLFTIFVSFSLLLLGLLAWMVRNALARHRRSGRIVATAAPRARKAPPPETGPEPDPAMKPQLGRRRDLSALSRAEASGPVQGMQDGPDVSAMVVRRLDQALGLLERRRISLPTYGEEVDMLRREVLLRIMELERSQASKPKGNADRLAHQLADARAALELVEGCLIWAREQADQSVSASCGSPKATARAAPPCAEPETACHKAA